MRQNKILKHKFLFNSIFKYINTNKMAENVCLLCLIGLPGSGKTYLASAISEDKVGFTNVEVVSFDELIQWENNGSQMTWKDKRRDVSNRVESIIMDFRRELSNKQTLLIVIDDNMYYRSMRYEFYRLARKLRSNYCQVFLDTPLEQCCEQNQNRMSSLPVNHIVNMNEKLERPSENNIWEKHSLTLSPDLTLPACLEAVKFLTSHCDVAPQLSDPSLNQTTAEQQQSAKHYADIALRKIVSQTIHQIKHSKVDNISSRIKEVIETRHKVLHSINNGDLPLPNFSTIEDYLNIFSPIFQKTFG